MQTNLIILYCVCLRRLSRVISAVAGSIVCCLLFQAEAAYFCLPFSLDLLYVGGVDHAEG